MIATLQDPEGRMSINQYWDLLNDRLVFHGYKPADYATARDWQRAGKTIVEACRIVMAARDAGCKPVVS